MKHPRSSLRLSLTGAGAVTLIMALCGAASAGVISTMPDVSFANNPVSITLGTGTFTFTGIPNTFPGNPPAEVSTSGSAMVTSFFGGVADFSAGSTIDQNNELYGFSSFSTPTSIPNSAAVDYIGLDFTNASGLHYGYAQVDGTTLINYAYESLANTTILTGATAVPEPSTIALMLAGVAGLVCVKRRRSGAGNTSPRLSAA